MPFLFQLTCRQAVWWPKSTCELAVVQGSWPNDMLQDYTVQAFLILHSTLHHFCIPPCYVGPSRHVM